MRLGIFAKIFARSTLEGIFDAVREHGLDCVQFNLACAGLPTLPAEIAPSLITHIREAQVNLALKFLSSKLQRW